MEAEGDSIARRLYGLSITIWSTSEETWVSSYVASLSGLVCSALIFQLLPWQPGPLFGFRWQITFVALAQFIGFLLAALAFQIIDALEDDGQIVSSNLYGTNTQWIWVWFLGLIVKPFCSSCALGAAIAYAGLGDVKEIQAVSAVGCLASLYNLYLILTDQVLNSAMPEIFWGAVSWGAAAGIVAYYGRGKPGFRWFLGGCAGRAVGFLLLGFAPCNFGLDFEESRAGCAFPQDKVHNIIFHLLVALSLPALCYGAKQKHDGDVAYEELLQKQAKEKKDLEAKEKEWQAAQEGSFLTRSFSATGTAISTRTSDLSKSCANGIAEGSKNCANNVKSCMRYIPGFSS
mmetsp:Transcript_36269/g.91316  ORF Transcript_36269/g.91316 Transcript_36269/m.91316 type:complete len:345 (-) Transcript_36269:48-1082(-)